MAHQVNTASFTEGTSTDDLYHLVNQDSQILVV